jgi:hypothetical protein
MFGFIAYDLVMPATQTDEAVVTGTSKHFVNNRHTYSVQGQGRYRYNEEVSRSMYERLQKGDTLRISLRASCKTTRRVSPQQCDIVTVA